MSSSRALAAGSFRAGRGFRPAAYSRM